jgi:signal transduction histidine kinase
VLDNLLTNAIKYTPAGGRINLSLSEKNSWGNLIVEDTGYGIPAQHLDRIFERFYRVDKARSRDMGGTGLGLSIVKHLVSGMDGEIGVESTVGVGSLFTVKLRLPS